jgi:predicted RNase H-like HicB family nuclease
MRQYTVIYEHGKDGGWGAYAPELPGLGAAAETREEAEKLIHEGIRVYLDELAAEGLPVPDPLGDPLLDLAGSGRDIWKGDTADAYVNALRDEWE